MSDRRVIIIGGGPAGLAAGLELARRGSKPVILERHDKLGGLARTIWYKDYGFDIGPHRFFTKSQEILDLWKATLGADFIKVPRLTRIYYSGRFFAYPIKAVDALLGFGPLTSARAIASYAIQQLKRKEEPKNLEDWIVQRFGRVLFTIFFKRYTEKVWGIPCDKIGKEFAEQRIRGLNLAEAIRSALPFKGTGEARVRSLAEQFWYPRLGAGQMHETIGRQIVSMGGEIRTNFTVTRLVTSGDLVNEVLRGERSEPVAVSHVFASAPITAIVKSLHPRAPREVLAAAEKLYFRSHITVNLIISVPPPFKDNWLYIHAPDVRMARIANYNSFSMAMVGRPNTGALSAEYFAFEGDDLWRKSDAELVALAADELQRIKLLRPDQIVEGFVVREADSYPAYYIGHLEHFQTLFDYLKRFKNLTLIGRAAMYRYNNQDHAMLTGLYAVRNYLGLTNIDTFSINAEEEYLEGVRPVRSGR
jgi:protoporphyrinogen oxidase